jgi:hypothetical protein
MAVSLEGGGDENPMDTETGKTGDDDAKMTEAEREGGGPRATATRVSAAADATRLAASTVNQDKIRLALVIRGSKRITKLLLSSLLLEGVALYGTKRYGTRRTVFFSCVPCARILAAIEAKNRGTWLDEAGDEHGRWVWRGYVAQPKHPLATTGRSTTAPPPVTRPPGNAWFQRTPPEPPGPTPPAAPGASELMSVMSMMSGMMQQLVELLTNLQPKPQASDEGIALAAAQEQIELLKAELAETKELVKAEASRLRSRATELDRIYPELHKRITTLQIEVTKTSGQVGTTHLEMQWAREHLLERMESLEKQQKSQSVVPHQPPRRDCAVQSTTELEVAAPELRQVALVEEAPAEPFEVTVAPATPESQLVCTLASKRQASESPGSALQPRPTRLFKDEMGQAQVAEPPDEEVMSWAVQVR